MSFRQLLGHGERLCVRLSRRLGHGRRLDGSDGSAYRDRLGRDRLFRDERHAR